MTTGAVTDTRRRLRLRAAVVVTFETVSCSGSTRSRTTSRSWTSWRRTASRCRFRVGLRCGRCATRSGWRGLRADGGLLASVRSTVAAVPDLRSSGPLDRSLHGGWDRSGVVDLDDEDTAALAVVARGGPGRVRVCHRRLGSRTTCTGGCSSRTPGPWPPTTSSGGRTCWRTFGRATSRRRAGRCRSGDSAASARSPALLARLVTSVVEDPSPDERGLVVMLDFDDPAVNPAFSSSRLRDRRAGAGAPGGRVAAAIAEVRSRITSESEYGGYRSGTVTRSTSVADLPWVKLLDEVLAQVGGRLLVVVDTVEQSGRRGPSVMYALAELVRVLVSRSEVFVVLSGRARMPELLHLADEVDLVGLPPRTRSGSWSTWPRERSTAPALRPSSTGSAPHPHCPPRRGSALAKSPGGDDPLFGLRAANGSTPVRTCGSSSSRTPPSEPWRIPDSCWRRVTPEIIRRVLAEV